MIPKKASTSVDTLFNKIEMNLKVLALIRLYCKYEQNVPHWYLTAQKGHS